MPRRKSEKIPSNTREAKKADWSLTRHNNRAGVSAFKKRLRSQYGRREGKRDRRILVQFEVYKAWESGTKG